MRRNFWLGILGVALIISLAWGFNERSKAQDLKVSMENQYHRSFDDFVTNLDGLETAIAKSKAAGTPTQKVYYLSQSWQQSETAVKDLAMLPAEQVGLSYLDQFVNQVGEYTRVLTRKVAHDEKLSNDEEKLLDDMHERLLDVNQKVQELYTSVNNESLAWVDKSPSWVNRLFGKAQVAEAAAEGQEQKPGSVRSGLDKLDSSLQKLPPFTYEGQTDTHTVPEPLGLPDKTVDQAESKVIAEGFLRKLGASTTNLESSGASQGPLGGFIWKTDQGWIEISKRGGVVTLYRSEREIGERSLENEEAAKQGIAGLKKLGFSTMVITSTEDFGGYLQLEAVVQEKGIRMYPDKIRFIVAKDNGEITGYDATPYYAYHHKRNLKKTLTIEKARAKLRDGFKEKENRLALISKVGREEAFCYEFRGSYKGEEYLIYINANNGTEEKIQRIIKTPRGEYLQ